MNEVEIFFFAWGVGFSGAIMPGPLLTVNIRESLKTGFWAGPKLIMGHASLEAFLIIALIFGLGRIIELQTSKGIISFLGGFFLLWMACGMMFKEGKSGLRLQAEQALPTRDGSPAREHVHAREISPIFSGILVSLANPYWTIWWATLGLGFLSQAQSIGTHGIVLFFLGHILADFVWYSLVSFAVVKGKTYFSPKFFRGVIIVCAAFLFYLSFDFLRFGVKNLGIFG